MVMGVAEFHSPFEATSGSDYERCAISSAVRFAIEPPLVSRPCAGRSARPYPINSASQLITVSSISVAAGPERHDVWFAFKAEAIRSANAPGGVAGEAT